MNDCYTQRTNKKNMKKLFLFLSLAMIMAGHAKAQDVANEIKRISKQVVDDQKQDLQTRRIAYFKVNAIDYMKMKIRDEVMRDTNDLKTYNENIKLINEQAYAMYEYVNLFVKRLAAAKTAEAKDIVVARFRTASINNPLFNDMDLELVQSYVNNDSYLTRFSLDTNWEKALEEIRAVYKK